MSSRSRTVHSRLRTATTPVRDVYAENEIICAISESRGIAPTVGLAFVNITTCEAVLCQLADTQTFARTCHKIGVFFPTEILFSKTAAESKLIPIIQENLDLDNCGIFLTPLDRKYWSESSGIDYLQDLAFSEDLESLKLSISGNFFACCSFAAAVKYIENELAVTFATRSLRIKFETSEGALMIDLPTIRCLELVQNLQHARSKDCLFGLLNQTHTRMGARLLKSNILQPTTSARKVKERYNAVEELSKNETMLQAVRDALKDFVDTDRTLAALIVIPTDSTLQHMERAVNSVLMLRTFVDSIQPVWQALSDATGLELKQIHSLIESHAYAEVKELVDYAINEDVSYSSKPMDSRNNRIYALKAGINAYLDLARQTFSERNQDALALVEELREQTGIDLEVKFDVARQYYMRIRVNEYVEDMLPDIFINVCRRKSFIECQTLSLVKMNQKIKDAHNEIISMSDQSIRELIRAVRTMMHPLFKISEAIALLDMLSTFAQLAITQDYTRPDLTATTMAIKSGRHPIQERIQYQKHRELKFIPNDVYATPQNRFQLITGCNMSGKSTHIRMIALLLIMAQIGSFVPAQYASFPIFHQLFARVSTDNSVEANVSTFASEMRETASVLCNIESSSSLVIFDELGRGTSTTDGLSIAIAIAEALSESRAYVWFVTHFRDLPRVLAERVGVVSSHMAAEISQDFSTIKMHYQISEGSEQQKFYGLALAQLLKLPSGTLETAVDVAKKIRDRNERKKHNAATLAVAKRRKLVLNLRESIMQANEKACSQGKDFDEEELRSWLKKLKEEFTVRMSAIDAEATIADNRMASDNFGEVTEAETLSPKDVPDARRLDSGEDCFEPHVTTNLTSKFRADTDLDLVASSTSSHQTTFQEMSPTQKWPVSEFPQSGDPPTSLKKPASGLFSGPGDLAEDPVIVDGSSSVLNF